MEVTFNKACNELEGKPTSFDLCHGHPVNRPTVGEWAGVMGEWVSS